jgi:hypothetical protein
VTNGQIFYRPNGIRLRSPFQIIAASGHGYSYERSSNLVKSRRHFCFNRAHLQIERSAFGTHPKYCSSRFRRTCGVGGGRAAQNYITLKRTFVQFGRLAMKERGYLDC